MAQVLVIHTSHKPPLVSVFDRNFNFTFVNVSHAVFFSSFKIVEISLQSSHSSSRGPALSRKDYQTSPPTGDEHYHPRASCCVWFDASNRGFKFKLRTKSCGAYFTQEGPLFVSASCELSYIYVEDKQ